MSDKPRSDIRDGRRALEALRTVVLYLEPWAGYYADVAAEVNGLKDYLQRQQRREARALRAKTQQHQHQKRMKP